MQLVPGLPNRQVVRVGSNISSPLTLNTGAPQGCVLSPLLYSLYTHDCVATHSSNIIVKFADDTRFKVKVQGSLLEHNGGRPDGTVACLALHGLEHMQLHLLFCTNNYCTVLHSKTLTVYFPVGQYKSYI